MELISDNKNIGNKINVLLHVQTSYLVANPVTVFNFAFLLNCISQGRTSDSITVHS